MEGSPPSSEAIIIDDPELIGEFSDGSRRNEALAELELAFGGRVFHYQSYSGTVGGMAESCPAFNAVLESGAAAAASWLEAHDEPEEKPAEEKPEEEPEKIDEPEQEQEEAPAPVEEMSQKEVQKSPEQKAETVIEAASAEATADVPAQTEAVETAVEAQQADASSDAAAETVRQEAMPTPTIEQGDVTVEVTDGGDVTVAVPEAAIEKAAAEPAAEKPANVAVIEQAPVTETQARTATAETVAHVAEQEPSFEPVSNPERPVEIPEAKVTVSKEEVAGPEEPKDVEIFHIPIEQAEPRAAADEGVIDAPTNAETEPLQVEPKPETVEYWPDRELDEGEVATDDEPVMVVTEEVAEEKTSDEAVLFAIPLQESPVEIEESDSLLSVEDAAEVPPDTMEQADEAETAAVTVIEKVLGNEQENIEPVELVEAEETKAKQEEVIEVVAQFLGEGPEVNNDYEPVEFRRRAAIVVEKIETLEQAKTAEACQESLQEVREELAGLLMLLGYANATDIAERLTKQYDTKTLRKLMAALIQSLASPERLPARRSQSRGTVSHRKYGSRVVQMAVNLPDPAQGLQTV